MKNTFAKVYVDVTHAKLDRPFDYKIPDALNNCIEVGMRVLVPFGRGGKLVEGYVVRLHSTCEISENRIKQIKEVIDEEAIFSYSMLKLAFWMKQEYMCTFVEALQCIMPAGIKTKHITMVSLLEKNTHALFSEINKKQKIHAKLISILKDIDEIALEDLEEEFDEDIESAVQFLKKKGIVQLIKKPYQRSFNKVLKTAYLLKDEIEVLEEIELLKKKNAHAQARILSLLVDNEEIPVQEIKRFLNISYTSLNSLVKNGLVGLRQTFLSRDIDQGREYKSSTAMKLTNQQAEVYNKALESIEMFKERPLLLHGVTGSGKTEVYLQLIQRVLEKQKQAIMLVPEISLTPQMIARFKGRFGNQVAVMHSKLSLGERYDQWQAIKKGNVSIVVGARSAIFAPFDRLGLIIIDEEHEASYKSEMRPKYHAIEVARKRCELEKASLLLGSATPSIETYYEAQKDRIQLLEIFERVDCKPLPEVKIVDMRKELDQGNKTIFSHILREEIKRNLENKQQTILFLNRRGFSTFVSCRKCGYVAKCPNCDISLTYHRTNHILKCHYCDYKINYPRVCPSCKDEKYIKHFGTGTQRIEMEIKKAFPAATILRMDLDTTSRKNAHEKILNTFQEGKADILLGTQMITKGLDFPNVTLVGVIAADMSLHVDDFRSSEKTFQLLTQVAGRAGRGEIEGRVIIQTYTPEHYSIIAAKKHDYHSFYNQEISIRKNLNYSPYSNIFYVLISGPDENKLIQYSHKLLQYAHYYNTDKKLEILGPTPAPLSKIQNKYRWRLMVKHTDKEYLRKYMQKCIAVFIENELDQSIQISADINPLSMY